MPAITSLGVGSGLDIGGLVDQLVAAEVQPASSRLDRREATLQAELSAFGTLKSALAGVQDQLKGLSTIGAARTTSSSNTDLIAASATANAVPGSYDIEVGQLAQAHALASRSYGALTDVVGTGTLDFQFGTTDYEAATDSYNGFIPNPARSPQTLIIDETNNTLEGVRDAINTARMGVNAVIVNDGSGYRLLLSAEDSGAANSLQITVSGDAGSGLADLAFDASATAMEQTVAAQDAALTINGLAITSPSNAVDQAIEGLFLDLNGAAPGEVVRVQVAKDRAAVRQGVETFIEAYNGVVGQIRSLTAYDLETQQGSILTGDSSVRSIYAQLRNGLISAVDGASETYSYLVEIGLESDSDGALTLDGARFDDAMSADFEGVVALLSGAAEGLGQTVEGMLGAGGLLDTRTSGLQTRIDDIGEQRIVLGRRSEAVRSRFLKQFTAMDTLLAQLQSTSSFISNQLANLPTAANLRRSN